MLGSRTKKVTSYGKRRQRVVNITSEERRRGGFDLDPTEPKLGTVVPSIRNRENIVPLVIKGRKVSSPKVVIPRLKKRSPKTPPKRIGSLLDTPARTPLAIFHPNGPGSPAILPKQRKPLSPTAPSGLRKPFSPFVEMDITVVDDQGQTLKKERRVSRTTAKPADDSDSDSVVVVAVRKPRRLRNRVVVSDDSGSEVRSGSDSDYSVSSSYSPPRKPKPKRLGQPKVRNAQKAVASGQRDATRDAESQLPKALPRPKAVTDPSNPSSNLPNTQVYIDLTRDTPPSIPAPAHYQPGILPIHKPRQLTPVRPGKNRLFAPLSPSSPTTTSELDFDFDDLSIGEGDLGAADTPAPSVPDYLRPLLRECNQEACGLHEFSAFISTFPFDPILSSPNGPSSKPHFRKVGEASYSEVFGIGDVVLKVIPLRDESASTDGPPADVDQPAPTDVRDVLKEIIVTRAMGEVYDGFVKLLKAYVVKGRYPEKLLHLWDEYNEQKGSESIRPDTFTLSQVYAIVVLPNGGPDLESYTFRNTTKTGWRQACSIFWQVAKSLAHAEQLVSFEHRDLHWGQILVKDLPLPTSLPLQAQPLNRKPVKKARAPMDDKCHGVQVTLIDLGLSRMDAGDGCGGEMIHWTPFDEEIFQGEGDYQFDVYRMMRDQNNGKWEPFLPLTNVMWLHYLLVKLLRFKGIKPPVRRSQAVSPASNTLTERECYECLIDLEQWLGQCLTTAAARVKPAKSRRKTVVPDKSESSLNPVCAGEVVEYGIKKAWIKPISR
ncbi:uncharacterized protein EV420DRAFT_1758640 [Desarmillaria tabescens]|uniref:non-specific serine/threonine protein kinase n=1 Tax=Armillaria tabescens TaxID=1929756 RepID=A0AA39T6S4_ARMTA|nr:uncharacterized protein EV420DRAFT_1758640 [Desarmillaria tabescens]KAK0468491.1 hypothetical protein EV420DRAFT_1758640 [Desarmillaria tabescens]